MFQPVFLWVILPNRGGDLTSGINVLSTSYVCTLNELVATQGQELYGIPVPRWIK